MNYLNRFFYFPYFPMLLYVNFLYTKAYYSFSKERETERNRNPVIFTDGGSYSLASSRDPQH